VSLRKKIILVFICTVIGIGAGASYWLKDFQLFESGKEKRPCPKDFCGKKIHKLGKKYLSFGQDTLPLSDTLSLYDTLLIASKTDYRMKLYAKGILLKTYHIALGQEPFGPKQRQGDNKTPEGVYKIIQKSRGPFYGDYSQYLGVAWMRLNYPNNADAINGFKKGLITEAQKNAIIKANNEGKEPPKNTTLGGGIGIHGWYGSWPGDDRQNLTWGCISMQNKDLDDIYGRVPLGTTIIIRK
jgi:hypothetical protein